MRRAPAINRNESVIPFVDDMVTPPCVQFCQTECRIPTPAREAIS